MRSRDGFTLLEAIVALTVLSIGLMAVFGWFNQNIRHLIKINDLALEEGVTEEALARLELEDFTSATSGSYQFGDYAVRWRAIPIEPPRAGVSSTGGQGLYEITLYGIELEIVYRGRLISTPKTRMTRFKKVRLSAGEL